MADSKPKADEAPPTPAEATSPMTAEMQDHINAQLREYSTYVANRQIFAGAALAYNPGDPVPVSNVQRHGYDKVAVDGGGFESWVDKVG